MNDAATANDLRIALLVHAAVATIAARQVPDHQGTLRAAGRFGEKVFISDLWTAVLALDAQTGGFLTQDCDIGHFKAWLLRGLRMVDDTGAPLVLLARADLVAAMDLATVTASEIEDLGCTFHFVLDRAADPAAYRPRPPQRPRAQPRAAW
jgi:hypothetical protein